MRISVFGLGYVGCVSAACLAELGHNVIGVDVSDSKVALINGGRSPLVETGLDDSIRRMSAAGTLRATTDAHDAICNSELSLICVGTPSNGNGSVRLEYLHNVCQQIGQSLKSLGRFHNIVVRSTVPPETGERCLIPLIERSAGRTVGVDFGYAMNPEFLREGSAICDFFHPSQIVIGSNSDSVTSAVASVYGQVAAPVVKTSIRAAELLKYVSNAFHALKIVFANEIGNICKLYDLDGRELMDIFCRDRQLNISPAYLRPGYAFGGSCLPKDVRALLQSAKARDLDCPLLSAILESNQQQVQRGISLVESTGLKKVGVLGLSFKSGTDDLRESAAIPLVETLLGRGYNVSVYDPDVNFDGLIGKNRLYVERALPHIASLMRDSLCEVVNDSDVVVLTNGHHEYRNVSSLLRHNQVLIDLVGVQYSTPSVSAYHGICW